MKKIKQAFTLFRLTRIYDGALKVWCSGAMLALPMFLFVQLNIHQDNSYIFIAIGAILQLLGFTTFIYLVVRRYEKVSDSARFFDNKYGSSNRFETFLQLEKSSHILKEQQQSDTSAFFKQSKFSLKMYSIFGVALLTVVLSVLNIALLNSIYNQKNEDQEKLLQQQKFSEEVVEKQQEIKRLANESAQLILTRPEDTELQAKPFDELEWQGEGDSPHGFKSIVLSVYVNGELRTEIPPEELPLEGGKIKFYSFLALEELNVNPFDLVSYHLTGVAQVGGEERTIYSPPGFIEIRPFREDAQTLQGDENSSTLASDTITLFLSEQIRLTKGAFALKIYLQNPTEEHDINELFANLSTMQQALNERLDSFIANPENRTLESEIINSLEQALQEMSNCVNSLSANDIDSSMISQQKAITHLIQALKNIKKVITQGQNEPPPPSPFEDKQEYETPESMSENNLHQQLQQLANEQNRLNQEIEQAKNGEAQNELANKQDELAKKLESLKDNSASSRELKDKLDQSQNSMNSSSESLNSGKTTAASQYGQQAIANLEGAAQEIEEKSNKETRETLNEIANKLDDIANGSSPMDELSNLQGEVKEAAQKQGESGTINNADKLNTLANEIGEIMSDENPLNRLQELKQTVNEMRLDNFDAQQYLEEAVNSLNEHSKHLKYVSTRPEELYPQEEAQLMADLEDILSNTELALDMMKNQSSNANIKSALGELQQDIQDINLDSDYAILSNKLVDFSSRLSTILSKMSRRVEVFVFDAEEIPKKYRKDTAEYFERLSNDKGENE